MSGDGEFDFQPKLGRIRSQGSFKPKGMKAYLKGARKRPSKTGGGRLSTGFSGARRVMIKARVHRLSGSGAGTQRAHISYLERDGAGTSIICTIRQSAPDDRDHVRQASC